MLLTAKAFDEKVEGYDDRAELVPYCPNCELWRTNLQ